MILPETIELLPEYDDEIIITEEDKEEEENKEESIDETTDEFNTDVNLDNEEDLDIDDLGRVYQLKRLYIALTNIYDISFDILPYDKSIKKFIIILKKTLDYYKMIIFNIDEYKEKLDKILPILSKFVKSCIQYLNYKTNKLLQDKKNQEKQIVQHIDYENLQGVEA